MRRPLDGPYWISSEFGVPDIAAKFGRHAGIDYAIGIGRSILAPVAGVVTDYRWGEYHGHVIQIFDGQLYHRMMHNSELLVAVGARVSEGQVVARSGATGRGISGPHLHWDIATQKVPGSFAAFISPADWLAGKYATQTPQGGDNDVITRNDVGPVRVINTEVEGYAFNETHRGDFDAQELNAWAGQPWTKFIDQKWRQGEAFRRKRIDAISYYDHVRPQVEQQLAEVKAALANEKARPPREVVKEVEKIVEKPVEVIVEVPVEPDEQKVVTGWLKRIWSNLFKK